MRRRSRATTCCHWSASIASRGQSLLSYYSGKPDCVIQPALTRFANAKGGRVAVMAVALAGCTATNVYNFRKSELILELFEWLGGKDVFPVRTAKDVNVVVTANEDAAKTRLHAVNLACDVREALAFEVAGRYRGASVEILDGEVWRPATVTWDGGRLTVPTRLGVFDDLVIRLGIRGAL